MPVTKVHARQIIDSRGNPTVEAEITTDKGAFGLRSSETEGRESRVSVARNERIAATGASFPAPRSVHIAGNANWS